MSNITEKLITIAENQQKVYDAGYAAAPKGSGTAQPWHVRKGYTFTNDDGIEYEGAMSEYTLDTYGWYFVEDLGGKQRICNDIQIEMPAGYYDENEYDSGMHYGSISADKVDELSGFKEYRETVAEAIRDNSIEISDEHYPEDAKEGIDSVYNAGYAAGLSTAPQPTAIYENGSFTTNSNITTFNAEIALYPGGVELISGSGWGVVGPDFESDSIKVSWDPGKTGSIVTNAMIDFTNYESIRIDSVSIQGNTHWVKGVLYKLGTDEDLLNRVDEDAIVFDLNTDFDLSEVSGEYYIGIFCSTDTFTQIRINKIMVNSGGVNSTQDGLWDIIQDYGKRTDYSHSFHNWGGDYIRPKYRVVPINTPEQLFNGAKIKKIEKNYFDLSKSTISDTTALNGNYYTFANCFNLEEIQDINMKAGYYYCTFASCYKLKIIEILRVSVNGKYNKAFTNCPELEEISTIEGVIGQEGFDVSTSPLLNHDTLMRIINALYDYSSEGITKTIKFGAANLAKLTAAEIAIATQKGWTIA